MCSWDRQFTYLIRDVSSNLILCTNSWDYLFLSDTFSKKTVIPKWAPRSDSAVILTMSRPEDAFIDSTATSIVDLMILFINCRQNCVQDSILDRINSITHFPVTCFCEASFQCLKIHCTLIGCWNTAIIFNNNFSVNRAAVDYNTFSPAAYSVTNNNVLIKSSIWQRNLLFCCHFLWAETISGLTNELYY